MMNLKKNKKFIDASDFINTVNMYEEEIEEMTISMTEHKAIEIATKEDEKYIIALIYCINFGLNFNEAKEVCNNYLERIYNTNEPISAIYNNIEDAGREYVSSYCNLPVKLEYYFNFEEFEETLDEPYYTLKSGRVVSLNM